MTLTLRVTYRAVLRIANHSQLPTIAEPDRAAVPKTAATVMTDSLSKGCSLLDSMPQPALLQQRHPMPTALVVLLSQTAAESCHSRAFHTPAASQALLNCTRAEPVPEPCSSVPAAAH